MNDKRRLTPTTCLCVRPMILVLVLAISHCIGAISLAEEQAPTNLIRNARQVTFEGRRSGEGYFSFDGSKMIFQSERDPKNPFYQIFVLDLNSGETTRVSNGSGKTTCAWFHPSGKRALFASTHEDPKSHELQRAALERRATGKTKRYEWDYDEHYEIYTTEIGSGVYTNLTNARGYDAEGSYSPDGKWIAFASNRHAYTDALSPEDAQLLKTDAKYFLDIYIMRADGSDLKRLTTVPGYDGGPFFSPDGKRICWRRFTPDGNVAEIWTMNIDGSDQQQITKLGGMSWAPFYHPSGEYLIFTTDIHGRSNFELYIVDVEGNRDPVRITNLPAFDGLPVFFPDGKRLAWTANRTANKKGQIYFADFDDMKARERLAMSPVRSTPANVPQGEVKRPDKTSSSITAHDFQIHRDHILEHLSQMGSSAYPFSPEEISFELLTGIDFIKVEIPGDNHADFQIYHKFRSTHPADNEPVFLHYTFEHSGPRGEKDEFSHELAKLMELVEYLYADTPDGPKNVARAPKFHVALRRRNPTRADSGESWAELCNAGCAAAIEFRGLGSTVDSYLIDGVGTSPQWSRLLERLNIAIGLRIQINQAPRPKSLGKALHEKKVPAISISPSGDTASSSGGHSNEIDLRATRLTARIIESLLLDPTAPEFTPITERADAVKGRPYLGTEPDYRAQVEGVLLKGVKENGPAHAGGLRGGDIIVEIADKPIADVHAYAAALDELEAGAHILIAVNRNGERVLLRVTVGERDG